MYVVTAVSMHIFTFIYRCYSLYVPNIVGFVQQLCFACCRYQLNAEAVKLFTSTTSSQTDLYTVMSVLCGYFLWNWV